MLFVLYHKSWRSGGLVTKWASPPVMRRGPPKAVPLLPPSSGAWTTPERNHHAPKFKPDVEANGKLKLEVRQPLEHLGYLPS